MRRALAILLALATAGLAVLVLSIYLDLRRLQAADEAAAKALSAARSYAADMLSYDYRTIDADFARAEGHATEELAARLRELAKTLGPEARRTQTTRHAVVVAAGVESATPDEVRVLVFVNLTKTSGRPEAGAPRQQVSEGRARLVLVTQGDGWRVSRLSTLLGDTPVHWVRY